MIGKKLADRYEIVFELGRGGMGVVYRARDPRLNRDVAVKVIPPAQLSEESETRFEREAQLVAQMDHPSIVPIYDFGRHEDALYFVMALVQGTNLRAFLREGPPLGDVVTIGIQVAEALEYSHARGVVHRDIKPENIMVAREEGLGVRVRVMDFGLARATAGSLLTRTGTLNTRILTIGFARRFATYKRATLILRDRDRLGRILNNPDRPVQLIFAGKAHPRDDSGKDLIRQVVALAREPAFRRRLVFLEDYDMSVSRYLVQGVDVWLNTPLRPNEASGTSGMKAAANGVLNLSTLDG